jgi:ComF family protein
MLAFTKQIIDDVFSLFYPHVCLSCGEALVKGEELICFNCEANLPYTGHYNNTNNELMQRLKGRVEVQGAAALYDFHKGAAVQNLVHELKYRKRQDAGVYMGQQLGEYLQQPECIIQHVDAIVPVPLHWKKEKQRGYNQCTSIAEGIADVTGLPIITEALERLVANESQTGKNRFERWENVSNIFAVNDASLLQGKHILLVDDVLTTGATAEACLHTILSVPNTKVSFMSVGYAKG